MDRVIEKIIEEIKSFLEANEMKTPPTRPYGTQQRQS
jgi:hypothetical protein